MNAKVVIVYKSDSGMLGNIPLHGHAVALGELAVLKIDKVWKRVSLEKWNAFKEYLSRERIGTVYNCTLQELNKWWNNYLRLLRYEKKKEI